MARPNLDRPDVSDAAATAMARYHADVVDEVKQAVASEDIVVVGMGWNPHVPKARQALDDAGLPYRYIGIGNYLAKWKPRLAVKLWSGWPTFPQVYVRGVLIGGNSDVRAALVDGSLRALLDAERAAK